MPSTIPSSGRIRPMLSIREIKVVGFIPKSSAAPSAPLIFQRVFCRTIKRVSRSRRAEFGIDEKFQFGYVTWLRPEGIDFHGRTTYRKIEFQSTSLCNDT